MGCITRPHGVRGEVKVQLYWQDSEALFTSERVLVRHPTLGEQWRRITAARRTNKLVILGLEGVAERDAAEGLRGAVLAVPRAALPPLEPGEYYLVDLVGAEVTCAGEVLGVVIEVRPYPTVDAVVIEDATARRYVQPLSPPWLERVDAEARRILLTSKDGLID